MHRPAGAPDPDPTSPLGAPFSVSAIHEKLFSEGSRTYYNATRFFPADVREKVTALYAFVRKVDNLVDTDKQDRHAFERFRQEYTRALHNASAGVYQKGYDPVIASFVHLMQIAALDPAWIDAFFWSMEADFGTSEYNSIDELIKYIYGSAEVIGLCMARIMELPQDSLEGAQMLGRAMQYINFIRDIKEDHGLGRRYIPLGNSPFRSLSEEETRKYPREFELFIRQELTRFTAWQEIAEHAFSYLGRRYRIAIQTASDMYMWSAQKIYHDPWLVYVGSIKPNKMRVIMRALYNFFAGSRRPRQGRAEHGNME